MLLSKTFPTPLNLAVGVSELVRPLALVHGCCSNASPPANPNGFLEPSGGLVGFPIDESGLIPADDMIGERYMFCDWRFILTITGGFPLGSGSCVSVYLVGLFFVFTQ